METKWLSSLPSAGDKLLTDEPLSIQEAVRCVESRKYGAIVTFSGCVRDEEENAPISAITYEVYAPMAMAELKKIVEEAESKWKVKAFVRHRVGRVPVREASVVIACAGAHRSEAFQASQFVIEQLKKVVPIWKVHYEKE